MECRGLVGRWAYGQMLFQAHPASQEPDLSSLNSLYNPPFLVCKVLLHASAQASPDGILLHIV